MSLRQSEDEHKLYEYIGILSGLNSMITNLCCSNLKHVFNTTDSCDNISFVTI